MNYLRLVEMAKQLVNVAEKSDFSKLGAELQFEISFN